MRRLASLALLVAALGGGCNFLEVTEPPALPAGTRLCVGLPQQMCLGIVQSREQGEVGRTIRAWSVRCSVNACTPSDGTADVTLVWSNGANEFYSEQWASAPLPAPTGSHGPAATIAEPT